MKVQKNKLLDQVKKRKKEMENVDHMKTDKKRELQKIRAQIKRLTKK